MDGHNLPTPDEARASLEQITASRTAAAEATQRPAWIDVGMSATAGATVTLGTAGYWAAAIVVLVVGSLVVALATHRQARGRGQVLDQRAIGARGPGSPCCTRCSSSWAKSRSRPTGNPGLRS